MNNLILIGMMGCGKSTVGRLAAEKLGLAFADTDERIEAAYATLFAFAIIVKILLLPVITSFL